MWDFFLRKHMINNNANEWHCIYWRCLVLLQFNRWQMGKVLVSHNNKSSFSIDGVQQHTFVYDVATQTLNRARQSSDVVSNPSSNSTICSQNPVSTLITVIFFAHFARYYKFKSVSFHSDFRFTVKNTILIGSVCVHFYNSTFMQ